MHLRPDLAALSARLGGPPFTRFAPSPTGQLHIGHVVNALYVWGIAGALGGRVLCRIEDHDRIRSRPEYETALIEDLAWLGLQPDADPMPVVRQSDTPDRYADALAHLRRTQHVYACVCSRKDVGGGRYTGRCRHLGLEPGPGRGLRLQMNEVPEVFEDGLLGPVEQTHTDQGGDLLLLDRDGHWTYQFAVVVDDLQQGITAVIRGMDLISSTGQQIALARLLGRSNPPVFLHHRLVLDAEGRKLSKSARDTGVQALRQAGYAPADVLGQAAAAVGLVDRPRPVPAAEVPSLFL